MTLGPKQSKKTKKPANKSETSAEKQGLFSLEPRIVFDAAAPVALSEFAEGSVPDSADTKDQSNPVADIVAALEESELVEASSNQNEIVFIDSSAKNVESHVANINQNAEVVFLDPETDGVLQIADVLSQRGDFDAIHIIANGSDAKLSLGTAQFAPSEVTPSHQAALEDISGSLKSAANILIYGSEFGAGESGATALAKLGELTGAGIAANSEPMGDDLGSDAYAPVIIANVLSAPSDYIGPSIVFVDQNLENVDQLLSLIDTSYEVVMIDGSSDGVEQIAFALDERSDLAAIHILSHGEEGRLFLGDAILDSDSIRGEHADELSTIGEALTEDGDILIYGCDFTGGSEGLEAAILLGSMTRADIAASKDGTGHMGRGGDWELEDHVGDVDADGLAATEWEGLLAPTISSSEITIEASTPTVVAAEIDGTASDPVVMETVVVEPVVSDPVLIEPTVAEPAIAEPVVAEPVVAAPLALPSAGITIAEDVPTALTAADFDANNGWAEIKITSLAVPAGASLTLAGAAVAVNDTITRAQIDAGDLVFTPAAEENGNNYATIGYDANASVPTSVDILAGEPSSWTLGGGSLFQTDQRIADPNLFGPSGTVPTSINVLGTSTTIDAAYLAQGNVYFDGYVPQGNFTAAELSAIDTWVQDGGVMISTNDSTSYDGISTHFGLPIGGTASSTWAIADDANSIMDGPFGSVGSTGDTFQAAGTISYFDPAGLQPGDLVLSHDNGYPDRPTIVLRQHGDGVILFMSDEGPLRFNTSPGTGMTTANDILIGNIFAWAIGETKPQTISDSVSIDVTPVNDAPKIVDDTFEVIEDGTTVFNPLKNDSDLESDVYLTDFVHPALGELELQIGESKTVEVDSEGVTIELERTYTNPVVFVFTTTENEDDSQPDIARVTKVTDNSFDLAIVEPNSGKPLDQTDGKHGHETVSYMVLEAGTWTLADGTVVEVGTQEVGTGNPNFTGVHFDHKFDSIPVVLSQIQTNNSDVAYNEARQHAVTVDSYKVTNEPAEYQISFDFSNKPETIGYLAIDQGTGEWSGLAFEAATTASIVSEDSTEIKFSENLGSDVNFMAQLNTFKGTDTSHIDGRELTGEGIVVSQEEEMTVDSEIVHKAEGVSWLAWGGSGILTASSGTNYSIAAKDVDFAFTPEQDDVNDVVRTFDYKAVDAEGLEDKATVELKITPEVDVVTDTINTPEDTAKTFNVLTNDNFEGPVKLTAVTGANNGTVSFNDAGNVTYTPNENFNGTETLIYTITENDVGTTETGTINITVEAVADAPLIGYEFDGTDIIYAKDSDGVFPTGTISVEMEFQRDETARSMSLLSYATPGSNNEMLVWLAPTAMSVYINGAGYSMAVAADTDLHQISFTYDAVAKDLKIYLDGELGATHIVGSGALASGGGLTFGQEQDAVLTSFQRTQSFEGTLYSANVYSSILTEQQIADQSTGNGDIVSFDFSRMNNFEVDGDTAAAIPVFTRGEVTGPYTIVDFDATLEDNDTITLDLRTHLTDLDGSETLRTDVSNIPVGAIISDGGGNSFTATTGSTSVDVSAWALENIILTPVEHSDADIKLEIKATAIEASNGAETSTISDVTFVIKGVADKPTLTTANETINQDTVIDLSDNITGTLVDTDGSETLSYKISNIPAGSTIQTSDGSGGTLTLIPVAGVVTVTETQRTSLKYLPPSGFLGTITLDVKAIATEGATGDQVETATADSDGEQIVLTITNPPPVVVTPIADQTGTDDTNVSFATASAFNDPDGDTLTYSATGLPTGLSINSATGLISGILDNSASQSSPFTVSVTVDDGEGGTVTDTFEWTVTNPGPTVSSATADQTSVDAAIVSLNTAAAFTDPDGDTLTYSVTGLPSGLTINAATGVISGTVDNSASVNSSYTVVVTADDDEGGTVTDEFTWTITNPAPTVTSATADQTSDDAGTVSLNTATAFTDSDGDTLTYSATGLPTGLAINTTTGEISGTVENSASVNSPFTVVVTANDNEGGTVTDTFIWTITNPAPIVDTAIADQTSDDAAIVSLDTAPAFIDPDGDTLTYSVTGLPSGLTINAATGVISGTVDNSASVNSSYTVVVTADDNEGGTVTDEFTWTITNPAPTVDTAIADQTSTDAGTVSLNTATAFTDSDGDTLTYSATGLPAGLAINTTTGEISGTVDNSASVNSPFTVVVTANDNEGGTVTDTFVWTITNPAPTVNTAIADQTSDDAAVVSLNTATAFVDSDGDTLTYSATGLPTGLAINTTTGLISGTIDNSASQSSPFTVVVTANDGEGGTVTDTFEWTVTNPGPSATADSATTSEDTAVNGNVSTNDSDVDGDSLTYSKTSDPSNGSVTVNSNGTFTYTPSANFNGTDSFTYEVSDNEGGTDTATVTITVTAVNDAPVAGSVANQSDKDGEAISPLTVTSTDVDGDTVTYSATGLPAGLTINASTGVISGTLDNSASTSSPYSVEVTVSDGTLTDTVIFSWAVENPAPTGVDDSFETDEDTAVSGNVLTNDTDPDGDTLVADTTLVAEPEHGTVTLAADGTFTYTPDENYSGDDKFAYKLSDGEGGTHSATVYITVEPVVDAPLIGYEFDGTDIIYAEDGDNAFPTDQITVDLVFQRDSATESRSLFGYAVPNSNNELVIWPTKTYIGVFINGSQYRISVAADTDVHRFTITYDSTSTSNNLRAFMDGELIATRNVSSGALTEGGALIFGQEQDAVLNNFQSTQSFKGTLYSANIYSTALTDQQVTDNSAGNGDTVSIDFSQLNNFEVVGDPAATFPLFTRGEVTDATTIKTFDATLEDSETITMDLRSHLGDTDGSEELVTLVSNIPVGVSLSDDAGNSFTATAVDSSVDVSDWTLENIILKPVENSDADITLKVSATATENDTGDTASVFSDVTFIIKAVADKPSLSTSNESIAQDTVIDLSDNLAGTLTDTDGSESLSYQISNIPTGSVVQASDGSGGTITLVPIAGVVSLTETQRATLQFLPPDGFLGTITLDVKAIAIESATGNQLDTATSDSDVEQIVLTITNTPPTVTTPIADRSDVDAAVISLDTSSAFTDADGHTLTYSVTGLPTGLSINTTTGIISGTIDNSQSQSAPSTVVVTADDGKGGTVTDTFIWSVTNPAPTAAADTYTINEDAMLTGNVLTNDTDPDGDVITASTSLVIGPTNGSVSMASDGSFTYKPNPEFNGTDSFTYKISDGEGGNDEASVSITVDAVADAPLIGYEYSDGDILYAEDTGNAFPTEKITIDLVYQRDNTTDHMGMFSYAVPGQANEFLIFQSGTGIDVWVGGDHHTFALPATTEVQQITVTFDGSATTDNVNLYANGVHIGAGQVATTSISAGGALMLGHDQDGYLSGFEQHQEFDGTYFSANVYDGIIQVPDIIDWSAGPGDIVAVDFSTMNNTIVTGHASSAIDEFTRGSVTYPDTIVPYTPTVEDFNSIVLDLRTSMQSADATETIWTVISDIPVGASISDGAGNSFISGTGSTWVDVSLWEMENIVLTPVANDDSDITLVITSTAEEPPNIDSASTESRVTFLIKADADAPTLSTSDETSLQNAAIDLSDNITGALTDTDGSETLVYSISNIPTGSVLTVSDGAGGTTALTHATGEVTITPAQLTTLKYTPPTGTLGTITLYVVATAIESASGDQVDDKTADSAKEKIVLTIINGVPEVSSPIADRSDADAEIISLDASTAFTDPDGGTLTYSASSLPTGLSINATTGVISGTIDNSASQSGPYTVIVTAEDGNGATVTDAFTWTVTNPVPTVTSETADQTSADAAIVSLDVSSAFTDVDADTLTYSVTGLPTGLSIDAATGIISGTVDNSASQSGPFTVVVKADDGEGGTVTDEFNWVITNPAPTVTTATANQTDADATVVSLNASAAFTDVDADTMSYTASGLPTGLTINASTGVISGTLDNSASQSGPYTVIVTADDGEGGTVTDEFKWIVTNPAPTVSSAIADQTSADAAVVSVNASTAFTDVDADTLTYSATGLPAGLTINTTTGLISGTIDNSASQSGPFTVVVTANDGEGGTVTDEFSWTVTNPGPSAEADAFTTTEDTAVTGNVLTNDTDTDGDDLTAITTLVTPPANGSVSMASDGTFTYTPNEHFSGTDSFTYQVSDGEGGFDEAVATITVGAVVDAPLIGYEFDGSDIIYATDASNAFPTDQISIDLVYQTDNPADSRLVFGYAVPGTHNEFNIWPNSTHLSVFINHKNYDFAIDADSDVHRFSVTYDSTTTTNNLKAYRDGELLGTQDVSSGALTAGGGLNFGQEQDSVLTAFDENQSFKGTLYSANIYSTIITDQQVADNSAGNGDTVSIDFSRLNNFEVVGDPASTIPVFTRGEVTDSTTIKTFDATLEDSGTITMDLRTSLVDTDGSETLKTVVSAIPIGVTLSDGTGNSFTSVAGTTSVDVSTWTLEDVVLTPVADDDSDINLTITATSTEISTNDSASVVSNVAFIIKAAADAPDLTTSNETIAKDTVIDLSDNFAGSLTDIDGSETLSYQISNIPTGSVLQVSDGAGGTTTLVPVAGVVTLTPAQQATLNFLPPTGFYGTITLDVVAVATEGATGDQVETPTANSATEQIVLTITNTAPTVTSPVADQSGVDATAVTLDTSTAFVDADGDTLTYSATGLPTGLTINTTTGVISGTIDHSASATGPYTVIVTADDGEGGTVTDTFVWTITNPAPTVTAAVADQASADADSVSLDVSTAYTDVDADTLTYSVTGLPAGLSIDANTGIISGDIDNSASQAGPYTVIVTADDGEGGTVTDEFTWSITNPAPTVTSATADQTGVDNTAVSLNASLAFTDVDADTLAFSVTGLPTGLSIDPATGVISGTIDNSASQSGPYTVTVTANDGEGGTVTDEFKWVVTNPAPTVTSATVDQTSADAASVTLNTSTAFTDVDADTLTYSATGLPAGLSIDATTGVISGTIDNSASQSGPYTVTVKADDGEGGTVTDEFTWTITNPAPIALADTFITNEDTAVSGDVLANDSDPDGDDLSANATLVVPPSNGGVSMAADGTFTYTPNADFHGTDTFTYEVSDGEGGTATEVATITVLPVNDGPVVASPLADLASDDSQIISVATAGAFSDVDGDTLSYAATSLPAGLSIDASTGIISGTINSSASQSGPYTVSVTAIDGNGGSVTDTFVWTVNNPGPTATADELTTNEDTAVTGDVSGNDSDQDGDILTFVQTSPAANGDVSFNASGTFTYAPDANFNGTDSFTYQVSDGEGGVDTATVTIWVTSVNDAPVLGAASNQSGVDGQAIIPLPITSTDVDGDTVSYSATGLPTGLSINTSTGLITGVIDNSASVNAPYSVVVTVTDPDGASDTVTFDWEVSNPVPIATGEGFLTTEDTAVTGNVLTNDSDLDGDLLTVSTTLVSEPANGNVSIATDGTFTYTPNLNYHGNDSFTYQVSDGEGGTATAIVTLTVTSVNDAPTVAATISDQVHVDNQAVSVDTASAFADVDADTLAYSVTGLPAGLSIDAATGIINGTIDNSASQSGPYSVTVTVSDGNGGTVSDSFVWTVTNPAPVVNAALADQSHSDSQAVTLPTAGAFGDPDGDTLTYSASGLPAGLTIDASTGVISGTLTGNASQGGPASDGNYTITVEVDDGEGGTKSDTFEWSVSNVAPTNGTPIPDVTYNDAESVSINAASAFINSDNDTLTYSATGLPTGLSINTSTGIISGTLDNSQSQLPNSLITVTVSDGQGGTATDTFLMSVTNPAPTVINPIPDQTSNDDQTITLNVATSFNDIDSDDLSFVANGLPLGLTLDASTGIISGTIDNSASQSGPYNITITANDGENGVGSDTFTWTILNPAPVVDAAIVDQTGEDSDVVSLDVSSAFSDTDSDTLTYAATGLPAGLSIDPSTGVLSGTVDADASGNGPSNNGTYSVTVTANDGEGGTVSDTFTWTVTNVAPTIVEPLANQTHADQQTVTVNAASAFEDGDGDTLTYSATGLPDGLSINTTTGVIFGTIDNSASTTGSHTVVVTASDGTANVTDTFTWTVTNPAPVVIIGTVDQSSADGDTVSVATATAFSDPDNDTLTYSITGLPAGLVMNTSTGLITGTIDNSASLLAPYTITVTADDGEGGTVTDTFVWSISNPAPTAADDVNATSEDNSVSGNVLTNDNDPDSDDLTSAPTLVAEPANGTVSLATNGTYTYTPDTNFNGTDSFTYSVSDGEGGTDTATVTITISPVNDAPIVSTALTNQVSDDSETVSVNVTGAFSDVEGDALTYSSSGLPAGLTLDGASGIISGIVDHSASVNSPYTVTIEASDGNGGAVTTSFSWGVINPGPQAANDTASTTEDTAVSGNLLGNDSDPDGDTIVAYARPVVLPVNGTVSISADGSYTYTPNDNFNGIDSFTYRITDSEGGTSDAIVTIDVIAENDRPEVSIQISDQSHFDADSVSLNVSGNFSDLDGDTLTYTASSLPPGLSINTTTGVISGTIANDASVTGPFTTTVTATDGNGSSISDSFNFTVTNRNPVVDSQMPDIIANDSDAISVDGASYFIDVDADVLVYAATGLPVGLSIDAASGEISGTLTGNASVGGLDGNGRYEITVTVDDGQGGTATDTFILQANNIDPTVSSPIGPLSSQDGNNITIDVTNNFANPDNDPLTFTATGLPAGLSLDPNSGLISGVIDSDASQDGSPYSVEISVDDGQGGTASQTFNWTITNPAPIVSSLLSDRTGHDAEPVSIDVANSFVDPDTDVLTFSVSGLPSGTSFDPATGVISGVIDPSASMASPYTITIIADDGQGGTVSQSFEWTITNIQPTAQATIIESVEDAVVSGTVVPLIGDADGDSLTTTLHTGPTNGSVTVNPVGTFTYTPNENYFGTDSFVYQVDDGEGGVETAIVTFNISPENDAPVTNGSLADISLSDAQSDVNIPTANIFADVDLDTLTYSAANLPAGLSIDSNTGEITGTVDGSASVIGSYPVIITASDGNGGSVTTSFDIEVENVSPDAIDDAATMDEDGNINISVLDNDQSPDGDTLTVTAASAPNGVVSINSDGTLTYTPNENFNGVDTITYTVSDGQGGTSTATVEVTVEAVNDGPETTGEIGTFDLSDGQTGVNIPLGGAFVDEDGDSLTFTAENLPTGLTIDPSTGVISGNVDGSASQSGPYTVVITVDDGSGGTVTSEFVINVTNVGPVAVSDANATSEDTVVSGNVLTNDSDADDDGIVVVTGLTTDPANGSVILAENGLYTYTPDDDFNGTDTFVYTIADGDGATAQASVTIIVSAVNDPPVLSSVVISQTGFIGTEVTTDISGSFTDIDSGPLTFAAVGLPPGLTLDPVTGVITGSISPSASTDAPYVITVTATDGSGGSVTTQFTWSVINRGPEGEDQSFTTDEDGPILGNILDTVTDADGDQLVVVTVPVNPPAHGTVHVNLDGSFNYTPDANYNGTDEFTYQVLDNRGGAIEVTVSVEIAAVNDAPQVISSQDEVTATEGEPVTITAGEHFVDVDEGSVLTYSASGLPSGLSIDPATGVISGSPELNASGNGPYTVTVFVSDGNGGFSSISFVIDVAPSVQTNFGGDGNGTGNGDIGSNKFDVGSAYSNLTNGGVDGVKSGIILETVNSIRQLGSSFEIHAEHPISEAVSEIGKLQDLFGNAANEFGDKIGQWDVKNITGFSLRSEVLALENGPNATNIGQILVEGFQFEKVLYLQITDFLPKLENSDTPRYSVTLHDGRPLPDWIDFSSDGLVLIHRPVDIENLALSIKVLLSNNESIEKLITVDVLNAKVALLDNIGDKSSEQSGEALSSMFENQTEEEVSALEDKKLFQALFE